MRIVGRGMEICARSEGDLWEWGGRGRKEGGNLCEEGGRFVGGGNGEGYLWEGEEGGGKFVRGGREIVGGGREIVGGGSGEGCLWEGEEICARREGDLWEGGVGRDVCGRGRKERVINENGWVRDLFPHEVTMCTCHIQGMYVCTLNM